MQGTEGTRQRVRLNEGEHKNKGGRPMGSLNKLAKEARDRAKETGALPHELLVKWGRGEPMSRKVPPTDGSDPKDLRNWMTEYVPVDGDAMRDCAKSAAPYFAPKLSTVEVTGAMSDAELDELIARAAAEAGISVAATGEGEKD